MDFVRLIWWLVVIAQGYSSRLQTNKMRHRFFMLLFIIGGQMFSQNYSYQDYRSDRATLLNINRHIRNNNIDSLKLELLNYKNRLGFTYYQCKALIANHDSDSNQLKFLDSAFMRGMTPLCLGKHLNKFDTAKVSSSFKKNYLRSYNARLINVVDSIHYQDQKYRQQMTYWHNKPDVPNADTRKGADEQQSLKFKEQTKQQALDSLWKLQSRADSTNLVKLTEIVNKYGWPGAKIVGDFYCQRPGPDVTMFFTHLGNTRRDYQISTLNKVIELCKRQDDSWQNASNLIFGLHTKFSKEFSQFSFLDIKDNKINRDESFFSAYNMSQILINSISKTRIEIKCSQISLFNDLKQFMLSMNTLLTASERFPDAKNLDENSFKFIESPDLGDNVILYRFAKND